MSRHSRRSFVDDTSTIKILPIIEAVGSDDEDNHWNDERMEHPEDDYHNEEELEASKRRKKPAKPPPLTLLKWQEENKKRLVRGEIYEELHAYEAQRRTTYNAKLEATKLYFKSLTDLLQNSFDETAKVYRLALGTSIAQSQYARAITQRATHQVPRDSSPTAALLHAWQEANTLLAATLEESAVDIEQNVVTVIASFQDALQEQKHQFENVGKPILEELEHMETQVQQTWDAYWKIASKTTEMSAASNSSFSQMDDVESVQDEHVPVEDLWMVEMQYQMSVSVQRSTWEKRGPEIVRLAHSSKEMEVTRRIKLNESMVQFLQCLKKLFKTISEEDDSVKLPATALLSPLESIHDDIEKKVMSHVEASLPKEFKLSLPDDSAMGFGLECDALVMYARVLEWKNNYTPMSAADRWRTALAVVTSDGYLHLFDLEPFVRAEVEAGCENPSIYPGSDPFGAMDHIFPFFAQALKAKSEEEGYPVVTLRDKMVPERTLRLTKRCTFQQLSDECCEIVQKAASKSILLGARQKPVYKAQLRILSTDAGSSDKDSFFSLLQQTTKS